ncbi:MAG: hypothetical protein KF689_06275 [Gemmatimonadaceae bacterium]|nr:hypothetical protein [Gemmatimonadaceae bacterium]MCW5825220.1 hypothetical protein [Gemmatimonadaceae bacterium]
MSWTRLGFVFSICALLMSLVRSAGAQVREPRWQVGVSLGAEVPHRGQETVWTGEGAAFDGILGYRYAREADRWISASISRGEKYCPDSGVCVVSSLVGVGVLHGWRRQLSSRLDAVLAVGPSYVLQGDQEVGPSSAPLTRWALTARGELGVRVVGPLHVSLVPRASVHFPEGSTVRRAFSMGVGLRYQ